MGEVCVFRKSEADNYEFLPEPLVLDVVTAAAVPHPPLQMAPDDSDEPVMEPDAEETLARTLDTVLRACCEARADGLVFGAIGCGAFANPPTHVARLWRQALLSAASRANEIRQVIFAVFATTTRRSFTILMATWHLSGRCSNGNCLDLMR